MQITALHLFKSKYKIWLEIMKPRSLYHSLQCLFVFQDFFFISKQAWLCGESSYFWAASISTLQLGLNRN